MPQLGQGIAGDSLSLGRDEVGTVFEQLLVVVFDGTCSLTWRVSFSSRLCSISSCPPTLYNDVLESPDVYLLDDERKIIGTSP